ncbi:MAG TPA: hypothetical protein VFL55_25515 [Acetobacteraceae bacterium]|nr:hypothetical protein [Acetobacteraceae bacterium]
MATKAGICCPRAGAAAAESVSGKTTLPTHLAVALGGDRRVVLVDSDPQLAQGG